MDDITRDLVSHRAIQRYVKAKAEKEGLTCTQVGTGVYAQAERIMVEYLDTVLARNKKRKRLAPVILARDIEIDKF